MSEFDLHSTTTRILECAKCDQLVAGEPVGMRVELHCGYCGFEDVRELSGAIAADDGATAYRGKKRDGRAHVLQADLSIPPKGLPPQLRPDDARAKWLDAKRALAGEATEDERAEREYRALWVGCGLANAYIANMELVRARALLETLLELLVTPAYRAIAAARLARVAAVGEATALADKWLDACPRGLRIAEVTSEIKVAEALVARARGDAKEVLRATGERDTADEFLGPTKPLAVALRVDAHERLGDRKLALAVYRDGLRRARGIARTAQAYRLAPDTRKRATRLGFVVLGGLVAMVTGSLMLLVRLFGDAPVGPAPIAVLLGGLLAVVVGTKL